MTKLNPKLNAVCVCFPHEREGNGVNHQYHQKEGVPIRFIPIEVIERGTTGQVGWHGSTWEVHKTKTGKLLCSLTEWSCVDGEADQQTNIVVEHAQDLFNKLDGIEGTAATRTREYLVRSFEVVPTI